MSKPTVTQADRELLELIEVLARVNSPFGANVEQVLMHITSHRERAVAQTTAALTARVSELEAERTACDEQRTRDAAMVNNALHNLALRINAAEQERDKLRDALERLCSSHKAADEVNDGAATTEEIVARVWRAMQADGELAADVQHAREVLAGNAPSKPRMSAKRIAELRAAAELTLHHKQFSESAEHFHSCATCRKDDPNDTFKHAASIVELCNALEGK